VVQGWPWRRGPPTRKETHLPADVGDRNPDNGDPPRAGAYRSRLRPSRTRPFSIAFVKP
jgi:hypothetical protein